MLNKDNTLKLGFWCFILTAPSYSKHFAHFWLPGYEGRSDLICVIEPREPNGGNRLSRQLRYSKVKNFFEMSETEFFIAKNLNFTVTIYEKSESDENFIAKSQVNIAKPNVEEGLDFVSIPFLNKHDQLYSLILGNEHFNDFSLKVAKIQNETYGNFLLKFNLSELNLSLINALNYAIRVVAFVSAPQRKVKEIDISKNLFEVSKIDLSSTHYELTYLISVPLDLLNSADFEFHFYKNDIKEENFLSKAIYKNQ